MRNWLDSKKHELLGAVLLAAALGTGCGGSSSTQEEVPAAEAADALGTASDSAHFVELERLIAGVDGNPERNQQEAFQCDPNPDVTEVQVCDRTIPSKMHFEWSNCTLTPPRPPGDGMGPGGQPPPDGGLPPPPTGSFPGEGEGHRGPPREFAQGVSSGTVDLTHDVTLAADSTCGTDARYDEQESATFSTAHTLSDGTVVGFQGTTTSTGSQSASDTTFTRSGTLDTTREVRDAQGQVLRALHLTGSLTVTFDRSSAQPTRTLNGTFDASFADGTTSTITVTDLVRAPPPVCRMPLSGTVRQVQSDGTEHVLSFGPDCGTATLDGQPYQPRGPHEGGEHGHGPGHGPGGFIGRIFGSR
ncbi:MAG: hypothetical protein ACXU86_01845 [Archangium sp.]